MWFNIIKMPNPYLSESGKKQQWKFLTREQYYEMDNKDKHDYHLSMKSALQRQLQSLRARHQPLAAAPETLQNELIDLQKLRNFHETQRKRIVNNVMESVFSIEEDKNPPTKRLQTTPMGNIQYGEWDMTEEEYNAASREEKSQYHHRMAQNLRDKRYMIERGRMRNNPNYTSPYNPEDAKSKEEWRHALRTPTPSKEEYENMSNDDKGRFHQMMLQRHKRSGEKDLVKFHSRMASRKRKNSVLPTYYSIEEERNA